jgi:hypothetical protein
VPAVDGASPRVHWLLLLAACCLMAQSTLLPLVSPSTAVWNPVHRHITINGVVPPHTHAYEMPAGQARNAPSCVVTDTSSTAPTAPHEEPVVCVPSEDGATSSVAITVHHEPILWRVPLAGFESSALPVWERDWHSVTLPVLTPPPRT